MIGLVVAWAGPVVLASVPADGVARALLLQALLWLVCFTVLGLVLCWEKLGLDSIGLKRFHWSSIAAGLALAAASIVILNPAVSWLMGPAADLDRGMAKVFAFPAWFRCVAAVTGGIVEEVLYRGYTLERLAALTGRRWLAAVMQIFVFAAAHYPFWGIGPVLFFLPAIALTTWFYQWRRDLLALIVWHVTVDVVALVR